MEIGRLRVRMMPALALVVFLVSDRTAQGSVAHNVLASNYSDVLSVSMNGNALVDNILNVLKEKKSADLEPTQLPDVKLGFKVRLFGEVELYNGYISGITTLRRTGDAGMEFGSDKKIHVSARLGAGLLNLSYKAHVTFLKIGPRINVLVVVQFADVFIDLVLIKGKPTLHEVKLHSLSGLSIKVKGLGPLNFLLNTIIKVITENLRTTIRKIVKDVLKKAIPEIINELV